MTFLRVVLVSAVWLGNAFGQIQFSPALETPPSTSTVKHDVSGIVLNTATGEPVRKALVQLQTGSGQNVAFSDASGHFTLEDVPEGMYGLQCQKPGYFGPGSGVEFQQIKVSATTETVTIKLVPAGSVSGRVIDDKGEPVEGELVQLLSENLMNGWNRWLPGQSSSTDEDGNYEIDNVQPGLYRLRLNMHPAPPFAMPAQTPQSRVPVDVYPAQYFPQGPDPSSAQAVAVQGGQTERADFTVTPVPGFRLRGVAGPFKPGAFIRVEDQNGNDVGLGTSPNGPGGRFLIPGVPSGEWRIIGQSFGSEEQLWGEQEVEVKGADLANIALRLEPLPAIPVEILGTPETGTPGLQVRLVRDDNSMDAAGWRQNEYAAYPLNGQAHDPDKASPLQFSGVLPGHYKLRAQTFGSNLCVGSVRFGSSDAERDGITVAPGQAAQPIQLWLRSDCASIQVKVNLPDGLPSAAVLILSDNPTFEQPPMPVGGNGIALSLTLTPGKYRLYAFDDVAKLEYGNPEALTAFEGKEVTLDGNQKTQVELDVIKRTQERSSSDVTH